MEISRGFTGIVLIYWHLPINCPQRLGYSDPVGMVFSAWPEEFVYHSAKAESNKKAVNSRLQQSGKASGN
jgi:hypothetical protein